MQEIIYDHDRCSSRAIPVQPGKGRQSQQDVAKTLILGMERVVLHPSAVADPGLIETLAAKHRPQRVIVSTETRGEITAIRGWAQDGRMEIT